MTEAEKYQQLLDEGIPATVLDALFARRPRRVDARVARSALRRDIVDARVEQATLEAFEETRERLRRLGFDVTGYELLPSPRPSGGHLADLLERAHNDPPETGNAGGRVALSSPTGAGTIRRTGGHVLGVR